MGYSRCLCDAILKNTSLLLLLFVCLFVFTWESEYSVLEEHNWTLRISDNFERTFFIVCNSGKLFDQGKKKLPNLKTKVAYLNARFQSDWSLRKMASMRLNLAFIVFLKQMMRLIGRMILIIGRNNEFLLVSRGTRKVSILDVIIL